MTNELVNMSDIPSSVSANAPTELPFTPRLQILHSLGKVIKEYQGDKANKPDEGDFWFGPPGGINLKRQFVAVPLSVRDHALSVDNSSTLAESYDCPQKGSPPKNPNQETFDRIMKSPKQMKEGNKSIFNYWGQDIFFWLPRQENFDSPNFAIYFFHSTARPVAEQTMNHKGKLILMKSGVAKSSQFSWPTPEVYAGPLVETDNPNFQCLKDSNFLVTVKEEVTKFLNPIERVTMVGDRPR